MNHKENDFRKICFYCASIYEAEDKELLVCPICGKSIPMSEYERIMQGMRQAVFGGWTCRIQYENEKNEGKHYYTEQCGEILNFVAIAVASGLIGNVSYDIVKKVLNKLKLYADRGKRNREGQMVSDFLESSDKIKKFSEYIGAYYDAYEGTDEKTKNAIMEEVFVDQTSNIIDGLIKMEHKEIDIEKVMEDSLHTKEEIMKMVLEIRNRVNTKRLEEKDFKGFWKDIDYGESAERNGTCPTNNKLYGVNRIGAKSRLKKNQGGQT